jgi:hypothetical protein
MLMFVHAGTLLQQSLQLALLKYSFEGAAPCSSQLQQHLLGSAGVLKGPSPEEEAAIVRGGARVCVSVSSDCALSWVDRV